MIASAEINTINEDGTAYSNPFWKLEWFGAIFIMLVFSHISASASLIGSLAAFAVIYFDGREFCRFKKVVLAMLGLFVINDVFGAVLEFTATHGTADLVVTIGF